MTTLDTIWNRARADLAVLTQSGEDDTFLWDHAARVAHTAQRVAALPSVSQHQPDESVILAAALYHDAAWAHHVRGEGVDSADILVRNPPADHREQGALMMRKSLKTHLSVETLEHAARIIMTMDDRQGGTIEKKIVSDADRLDEFGVVALWTTIRRGVRAGDGIQRVIDRWHRRTEYHFWTARLKDYFYLDEARTVASGRLAGLEKVIRELEVQQVGGDVGSKNRVHS